MVWWMTAVPHHSGCSSRAGQCRRCHLVTSQLRVAYRGVNQTTRQEKMTCGKAKQALALLIGRTEKHWLSCSKLTRPPSVRVASALCTEVAAGPTARRLP